MGVHFNADEIFEIAERIERNGARFYRKAAQQTGDAKAREMLGRLALMEDDHEKTFGALRKKLCDAAREKSHFDPDDELASYLRAFADGSVFDHRTDPATLLSGRETVEQILKTAIGLEKDSILFYLGLEKLVAHALGKSDVGAIIDEERGHIALLAAELNALRH